MTTSDQERLAEIRALALAATPGPWRVEDGTHVTAVDPDGWVQWIAKADWKLTPHASANLAYIAALDPQTVLGLIAQIEELEKELREVCI